MELYRRQHPSKWESLFRWAAARAGATMLMLAGVGVLVWTAYRSPRPTPGEMALLALFASAFNIWGGAQFANIGRADPKHARSAVRRLYSIGTNLNEAAAALQESIAVDDPRQVVAHADILLSQVNSAQRHLIDAIGDWNDVHPEALREVLAGQAEAQQIREGVAGHD